MSVLKGIIGDFCSANLVCDEKQNSTLIRQLFYPMDRCISYRFLLIQNRIQMK